MTSDQLRELGDYCEFTLAHPQFNLLVELFEQQTAKVLLATPPHQKAEREDLYAMFNGLREFLGHMMTLSQESQKLRDQKDEQPSTSHELPDDVVFDLFRKE